MNFTPKNAKNYFCEICDFECSKNSDWTRHIQTGKHKNRTISPFLEQKTPNSYICPTCNKSYAARNSLWYHSKKCNLYNNDNTIQNTNYSQNNIQTTNDLSPDIIKLITELVKGQSGLQESILELCKNGTHNTTNNTNTTTNMNSHNKTFNLNVFLNETCKDAMNINDFIDSIQLQVSDLINVGEVGFVEGISNIIVKNLDKLDVTQRPVHCTDKKREVVYIKDENKWEKEDDEKKRLRKAIKKIAFKNEKMLFKYKEKYPDCIEADSRRSDQYNKIIIEAMGGRGNNDTEKEDKIIRNITKKVVIDKENNYLSN
jgi:hypothetical protein